MGETFARLMTEVAAMREAGYRSNIVDALDQAVLRVRRRNPGRKIEDIHLPDTP